MKPIASVIKRGNKLRIRYRNPETGKMTEKSTGLDDTPDNRRIIKNDVLPKLKAKIALGQLDSKSKAKPFEFYAKQYLRFMSGAKTYDGIRNKVENVIMPYFNGMMIDKITKSDVRNFALDLLDGRKKKTVSNILTPLRGIFEIADDVVVENPAKDVKLPRIDEGEKEDIQPFKPEEISKILSCIEDEWYRNFAAIGFYTGMRTGEILGLMHNDFDFDLKVIRVRRRVADGKISRPKTASGIRDVPMFESVIPYVRSQLAISNSLYLFTNENGNIWYGAETVSRRRWRKALKKAGVSYRTPYNMRHTFITAMLRSGKLSLLEIARMVGHSNIEMIIRNYARFIEGEQLKIERSFDPFFAKKGDGFGDHMAESP